MLTQRIYHTKATLLSLYPVEGEIGCDPLIIIENKIDKSNFLSIHIAAYTRLTLHTTNRHPGKKKNKREGMRDKERIKQREIKREANRVRAREANSQWEGKREASRQRSCVSRSPLPNTWRQLARHHRISCWSPEASVTSLHHANKQLGLTGIPWRSRFPSQGHEYTGGVGGASDTA